MKQMKQNLIEPKDPIRRILREMGLSEAFLSPNYEQDMKVAQEKHAALLERIRLLEKLDPEFWCNMPWSKARAEWEATEGLKNEPCTDPRLVAMDGPKTTHCVREHLHRIQLLESGTHTKHRRKADNKRFARMRQERLDKLKNG